MASKGQFERFVCDRCEVEFEVPLGRQGCGPPKRLRLVEGDGDILWSQDLCIPCCTSLDRWAHGSDAITKDLIDRNAK